MMNIYTGEPIWNPIKDWFDLSNFYMFPTEDAADLTPAHSIMEPHLYAKRDESIQNAYLDRKNSWMKSQYKRKADATKRIGDIGIFSIGWIQIRYQTRFYFLTASTAYVSR